MAYPQAHVLNPSIPYTGPIQGGLTTNKMVFVQGSIPYGASRFSINLQYGQYPGSDIALHFNPRFEFMSNKIVRNSFTQGNNWGKEERGGNCPFSHGQSFEVIFLVLDHCFKIAINGSHYAEYKHRMSKEAVNCINIQGDVQISCIRFEGGTASYSPAPPPYSPPQPQYAPPMGAGYPQKGSGYAPPPNPYAPVAPIYNPAVPFIGTIPGGLFPGKMISISGSPSIGATRFNVNLKCGMNGNIAFHFDVRLKFNYDKQVVVRNTCEYGSWGKEERDISYFPFAPSANFDMIILCESHALKIAVNNQHFVQYSHRIFPLNTIDTLDIEGDVRITQINYQ